MPTISMFYGIIIRMFFKDIDKHHTPHIHAEYQDYVAQYAIHQEDLLADWTHAVNGLHPFTIKGLE